MAQNLPLWKGNSIAVALRQLHRFTLNKLQGSRAKRKVLPRRSFSTSSWIPRQSPEAPTMKGIRNPEGQPDHPSTGGPYRPVDRIEWAFCRYRPGGDPFCISCCNCDFSISLTRYFFSAGKFASIFERVLLCVFSQHFLHSLLCANRAALFFENFRTIACASLYFILKLLQRAA
jgi:hypothetical protein